MSKQVLGTREVQIALGRVRSWSGDKVKETEVRTGRTGVKSLSEQGTASL